MELPIHPKPAASATTAAPYDDAGALVLTEAAGPPNSIAYSVSLSGVSIARELSETQPAFHKAFGEQPHRPILDQWSNCFGS